MKCPFCQHPETKVVDSRLSSEGENIRRRRSCDVCGKRFTTYERIEVAAPMVIKRDGSRENFDRMKILKGIQKACEKRSVSAEQMTEASNRIERKVSEVDRREVPAEEIGKFVMNELRDLDEVAYVRFASVYRSFRDVNEFLDEIKDMVVKR